MYITRLNNAIKRYEVVNTETYQVQSSWVSKMDAKVVAKSLSLVVKVQDKMSSRNVKLTVVK